MSTCRGPNCRREVLWAVTTPAGKAIPLDPDPNPAGNMVLTGRQRRTKAGGLAPEARQIAGDTLDLLLAGEARYMPHHATCPDAGAFR